VSLTPFELVLESARLATPRVRELSFARADGAPLGFVPGQFITFHIPHEEKELRRSYSIATVPGSSTLTRIAAAEVTDGRATRVLFGLEPGARVKTTGPFGRFVLREDPPCRYLLLATGTGVSPYRTMLPELERRVAAGRCEVELLLGVRGPDELLYGDEFRALAARQPGFRFHACYSRRMPEHPGADESRGYVQDLFQGFALDPQRDIAYLCGNPGMIDVVAEQLKQAAFPIGNVRREKYVSSN
jgi:ferredoxin-NADP reductase